MTSPVPIVTGNRLHIGGGTPHALGWCLHIQKRCCRVHSPHVRHMHVYLMCTMVLHCAVLSGAVLCCAVLCHAVLCYAELHCAELCCAVLMLVQNPFPMHVRLHALFYKKTMRTACWRETAAPQVHASYREG